MLAGPKALTGAGCRAHARTPGRTSRERCKPDSESEVGARFTSARVSSLLRSISLSKSVVSAHIRQSGLPAGRTVYDGRPAKGKPEHRAPEKTDVNYRSRTVTQAAVAGDGEALRLGGSGSRPSALPGPPATVAGDGEALLGALPLAQSPLQARRCGWAGPAPCPARCPLPTTDVIDSDAVWLGGTGALPGALPSLPR